MAIMLEVSFVVFSLDLNVIIHVLNAINSKLSTLFNIIDLCKCSLDYTGTAEKTATMSLDLEI